MGGATGHQREEVQAAQERVSARGPRNPWRVARRERGQRGRRGWPSDLGPPVREAGEPWESSGLRREGP